MNSANSTTLKVVAWLLSVFVLLTLGSQLYFAYHDKFEYNVALEYEVSENISFKGIIVRDETLIKSSSDGVIDYRYSDGSKISAGSLIAECYSSKSEILSKQRIDAYEKEIANLKEAQSYAEADYSDADSVKKLIDEKYSEIINHIQLGEYELAQMDKSELLMLMNKYNIITGVDEDYNSLIESLTGKIELVKDVYSDPISTIVSEKGGYFVSVTDGYEEQLNYETIYDLTADDINSIIENPRKETYGTVGKCFDSYSCKIIGIINTDNPYFADTYLSVKLSSGSSSYEVYVESIEKIDDEGNCIIILDCEMMDSSIIKNRVEQMHLVFDDYKGIKVDRKAIRFVDNQKGVYIIYGEDMLFKKINVIYEGDDFVLAEITDNPDYLNVYDQIVLEGYNVKKR
ncbi:MAG: hypothetical protein IJC65_00375 [Oscillospiraceae bacterium]|nr:hypothetical protein [Oscillospiraceae bacterium]